MITPHTIAIPRVTVPGAAGRMAHQISAQAKREEPAVDEWNRRPGAVIKKVRYTHDAMIDAIVQDPSISQDALAAVFGYTPSWVSQVMSSDAFIAKMEERKEELIDPQIRMTLNEKFNALVSRSLDVLHSKLMENQVDPQIALQAAALGAKALGVGGNGQPIQVFNASDRLEMLGNRLTGLLNVHRERSLTYVQDAVSR